MVLLSGELIDEGIASFQCLGFFWFHIFEKAPERSGSLGDHHPWDPIVRPPDGSYDLLNHQPT